MLHDEIDRLSHLADAAVRYVEVADDANRWMEVGQHWRDLQDAVAHFQGKPMQHGSWPALCAAQTAQLAKLMKDGADLRKVAAKLLNAIKAFVLTTTDLRQSLGFTGNEGDRAKYLEWKEWSYLAAKALKEATKEMEATGVA